MNKLYVVGRSNYEEVVNNVVVRIRDWRGSTIDVNSLMRWATQHLISACRIEGDVNYFWDCVNSPHIVTPVFSHEFTKLSDDPLVVAGSNGVWDSFGNIYPTIVDTLGQVDIDFGKIPRKRGTIKIPIIAVCTVELLNIRELHDVEVLASSGNQIVICFTTPAARLEQFLMTDNDWCSCIDNFPYGARVEDFMVKVLSNVVDTGVVNKPDNNEEMSLNRLFG